MANADPTARTEVEAFVTGFGPFRTTHPINPSELIAASLPSQISLEDLKESPLSGKAPVAINIHGYTPGIRVAYDTVDKLIPAIYKPKEQTKSGREPQIIIHIGMAGGREGYTIEQCARGTGYTQLDVDGLTTKDGESYARRHARANGLPIPEDELFTGVDVPKLCAYATASSGIQDITPSSNAGHYLCEYIYYSALANFGTAAQSTDGLGDGASVQGRHAPDTCVIFLHVPGDADNKAIETGRKVVLATVRGLAAMLIENEVSI